MALSDRFGPLISANHVSLFLGGRSENTKVQSFDWQSHITPQYHNLEKYKYKIKNKQNNTKK